MNISGWKTYAVCAVTIVYALSAWSTGHMDANSAVQAIFAAIGGMTMRHAVTTEAAKNQ